MNILITGASSGIGFETALELLRDEQVTVVALARSASKLAGLEAAVRLRNLPGKLYVLPFDLLGESYAPVLQPVLNRLGVIDVLLNNAGQLQNIPFRETSASVFAQAFEANVISHIRIIQAVIPFLAPGSHILNIGSMGGFQGSVKFPGLSAYSMAKAALHTLTECLAQELAGSEIRVNCLALGSAQTEMLEAAFPGYQSPVSAGDMGKFVAGFALTGHKLFNGKVLPVAMSTP